MNFSILYGKVYPIIIKLLQVIFLKPELKNFIKDCVMITAGCILYAAGFCTFIEPNNITPGGVTGIAEVIHKSFGFLPVGVSIIAINIPLFLFGFKKFKVPFLIKSLSATFLSSVMIDVFSFILPKFTNDILLASLFGGAMLGASIGLIFLTGGTTGGTDIIAKMINDRFSFFPVGRLLLLLDASIILVTAYVFKSIDTVLYSALFIFVSSLVTDKVIYGADNCKLLIIVTSDPINTVKYITDEIGRGVTRLKGNGGYTESEKTVLMCAVRRNEAPSVANQIKKIDGNAFVIVTDANNVIGEGFKSRYS